MFHNKCNQNVYVIIDKMFHLLVAPAVGKNVLLARRGFVNVESEVAEVEDKDFYCTSCNVVVPKKDIIIRCMNCGNEVPMLSAYKNMDSALIVCKECSNPSAKRLELMSRKISIKNI